MTSPALPAVVQARVMSQPGLTVYVPYISGLQNAPVQNAINESIYHNVMNLIQTQYHQQQVQQFAEMTGTFEIKTNERNILSLVLTNYAIAPQHANGLTVLQALTFDTTTGEIISFHDLFARGSDYKRLISSLIQKQIKERDITLLDTYPSVKRNQSYYIADQTLVVFYQPLEITPHYVGAPMFPIPIYQLQSVIAPNSILEKMS
ncbi:hypothetical protein JNUCC1_00208 [Lentibacillus sp. JNUCC-1]|uniref:DUF3298 and DUF4163 domain-containing protein n=1 Tax=Lentibacillus sp. JNUCC-1 TaxID=2654513 RepID=UPI00132AF6D3|nr:DUF3298 and DUF4163 domain-containing protein [Lentibacillus sp. JNUCC-1]MUV36406.1 hypothetical protein [Lentibacillus sp. JNUCC-1]